MSQVRKLQKGNGGIPKTYTFQLDSQIYAVTDNQLKEIDNRIAQLDPNLKRFLGNWTNAMKSGNLSGNRAENTVSTEMVGGVEGKDMKRLENKKPTFWESFLPTDSYYAKQAINEALNITASVLNAKPEEKSQDKTIHYNKPAGFDYDTDSEGKQVYSKNPKNKFIEDRFNAYLDWLSDNTWGDTNKWEVEIGDNEPVLKSWYGSLGSRDAAKAALDAAMDEVRTKPWNDVSEQARELLAYFNIIDPTTSTSGVLSSGNSDDDAPLKEDGTVDPNARTANGAYRVWKGTGKDAGKLFTNSRDGDAKPYLLNADRLKKYGLGKDYLNGLVYKGRIFKPDEVSSDLELQDIMDKVVIKNNSAKSTADVWANVGSLIDFTDWADSSVPYNYDTDYLTYQYSPLRNILGKGYYSIFNPSRNYELPEGTSVLGVYNFNDVGKELWGFRTPQYYIFNDRSVVGPTNIPTDWKELNREWSTDAFPKWENIKGKWYGLVGEYWGSDGHDTVPYKIYEGQDGNFYTPRGDGEMQLLEFELAQGIINGTIVPNHNQMWYGTVNGSRPLPTNEKPTIYVHGYPITGHKEGGRIKLKPLPAKLQMGSKLGMAPTTPELSESTDMSTPISTASNIWETLTPADQKEIAAAAVDVAGAIAGLIPGGSLVGAGTGMFVSTPLYLSAAKDRKGHIDAADWGQAALATGLDLVSLIPYLGETGKIAKIAKAVSRVAVPLGKAFNALGLMEAASVLTKDKSEWTTDDLLKLSAGIQSILNIGHGLHVRRGESALASEISNIAGKSKNVYSKKFKTKTGDIEIPLEDAQVRAIAESKKPGEELKKILTDWGVAEDDLTDMNQVLRDFGFDVTKSPRLSRYWTRAKEAPNTDKEYSKYGYLFDEVWDPIGKREFDRRAYIDKKLGDAAIREKLSPKVKEKFHIETDVNPVSSGERIITDKTVGKNNAIGRAYAQALARRGDIESSWFSRAQIPVEESSVVDRTPGIQAAITRGDGLPEVSQITREAGKLGTESLNEFAEKKATKEFLLSALDKETSKLRDAAIASKDNRVVRLGAEAVSNKDLIDYINGKDITYSDAVELLMGLSERKRNSLLNAIAKPGTGNRAKKLRREYLKSKGLSDIFDSANTDELSARLVASGDAQRSNAKSAFNTARDIANNLVKLRESKDPMKTLRTLSRREGFDQWVYDHPEEFREALEYAKRKGIYSRMTPKQQKQYDYELNQLIEGRNLIFKKGGVLKAQGGMTVKAAPFGKNYEDEITLADYDNAFDDYIQSLNTWNLPELNDGWHTPTFDEARDAIVEAYPQTKPLAYNTASTNTSQNQSNRIGGNTKPIKDKTKWLLPFISAMGYFENALSRKRYRDLDKKRINARRFNEQPLHADQYPTDNPTYDRALAELKLRRMSGLTGLPTSDWIQHLAAMNQNQASLDAQERELIGKKSEFDWQARKENVGIANQNNIWAITTANKNGDNNALINSMLYNPDLEYELRGDQSRQNARLEVSNTINKDINLLRTYNKAMFDRDAKKRHLQWVEQAFPGKVEEYNSLPADKRLMYADIDDYLDRTVAGASAKLEAQREIDNAAEMEWLRQNGLNYDYTWLAGRRSPNTDIASAKKGGRLNGTARYKYEPDEQIWIDNNKAAHNAVAKLSDATIKMLLRMLK